MYLDDIIWYKIRTKNDDIINKKVNLNIFLSVENDVEENIKDILFLNVNESIWQALQFRLYKS